MYRSHSPCTEGSRGGKFLGELFFPPTLPSLFSDHSTAAGPAHPVMMLVSQVHHLANPRCICRVLHNLPPVEGQYRRTYSVLSYYFPPISAGKIRSSIFYLYHPSITTVHSHHPSTLADKICRPLKKPFAQRERRRLLRQPRYPGYLHCMSRLAPI